MVTNQKGLRFDAAKLLVFICMVYVLDGLLFALIRSDLWVVYIISILAVIGDVLANHYLRRFPAKHWTEHYTGMVLIFGYVLLHVGSTLDKVQHIVIQYPYITRIQFFVETFVKYLVIVPTALLVQKGLEAFFPPYGEDEEVSTNSESTEKPPRGYTFVGTPPDDK